MTFECPLLAAQCTAVHSILPTLRARGKAKRERVRTCTVLGRGGSMATPNQPGFKFSVLKFRSQDLKLQSWINCRKSSIHVGAAPHNARSRLG